MAFIPNVKLNNFRSLKEITFEKNNNNEKKELKNHQNTATGFFSTFHMQTMVALL